MKEFGHVFIYVKNDKTGRHGMIDYYPVDPGKSPVHTEVPRDRKERHAAVVINSTPAAEDRMLDKMDEIKKKNPPFVSPVEPRPTSDCVVVTEEILAAGGIISNASTPTGLWEDLYDGGIDLEIGPYGIAPTRVVPAAGALYGGTIDDRTAAMQRLLDLEEKEEEEAKPHQSASGAQQAP